MSAGDFMAKFTDTTNSAQAFDAFAKKLQRFSSEPTSKTPSFKSNTNKIYKRNIEENEQNRKKDIIATYKKFLSPFEILGNNSQTATDINRDKENLLAAYKLHSALQEINAQFATEETFFISPLIETPLTKRDRYTMGSEFIYLQCWLVFENGVTDFIPQLVSEDKKTWSLQFVPKARFRFPPKEHETAKIISECFYSNTEI